MLRRGWIPSEREQESALNPTRNRTRLRESKGRRSPWQMSWIAPRLNNQLLLRALERPSKLSVAGHCPNFKGSFSPYTGSGRG